MINLPLKYKQLILIAMIGLFLPLFSQAIIAEPDDVATGQEEKAELSKAGLPESANADKDRKMMPSSSKPQVFKGQDNTKDGAFKNPSESPKVESTPLNSPKRPIMLKGRIEELTEGLGASLPVVLRKQVPKMDLSSVGKQTRSATVQATRSLNTSSYPADWQGVWGGTLTIHAANFSPIRWQLDAAEASQEQELLKAGTKGQVNFNFSANRNKEIYLEPAQVIFSRPMDAKTYERIMQQTLGQENSLGTLGSQLGSLLAAFPYMYALHLGDLSQGTGVTGNDLKSRLLRNEVKQISPGVIEQEIITYDMVRGRSTGKTRYSYSENVIRFTKQSSNQLYVQVAIVTYLSDGRFKDKTFLYGTVERGKVQTMMPVTAPQAVPNLLQNLFQGF